VLGEHKGRIDDKRRVSLPRKLRESLSAGQGCEAPEFTLARGLDGCIWLLNASQWHEVEKSLGDLRGESFGFGSKEIRAFIREFYRRTSRTGLDRQGRITLPEPLMELTGCRKEVVFIAMPQRIEIWASERNPSCDDYDATAEKLFG
jgi:MraZ protein